MSIECIHDDHERYFWGSYDGAASLGYRDVAFNLRLRTAAAREFGVDTHVCEVQLLLRPFAELKVMTWRLLCSYTCIGEGAECREKGFNSRQDS